MRRTRRNGGHGSPRRTRSSPSILLPLVGGAKDLAQRRAVEAALVRGAPGTRGGGGRRGGGEGDGPAAELHEEGGEEEGPLEQQVAPAGGACGRRCALGLDSGRPDQLAPDDCTARKEESDDRQYAMRNLRSKHKSYKKMMRRTDFIIVCLLTTSITAALNMS